MAFTFQLAALIGPEAAVRDVIEPSRLAPVVGLTDTLALVPVTRELMRILRPSGPTGLEPGFRWLHARIAERAIERSAVAPVAYVEAEFIGGTGAQSAIAWRDGQVALGPLHVSHSDRAGRDPVLARVPAIAEWPINRALRALGVVAARGRDEFDTVRLGRHRHLEQWLEPRRAAS